MAINIRSTGKLLESMMYGDKMSVYKHEEIILEDGSTQKGLKAFADIDSVPCKISYKTMDSPDSGTLEHRVITVLKLFLSLDYKISKGDYIEATRTDTMSGETIVYVGYSGEPNRYDNHQEIELIDSRYA